MFRVFVTILSAICLGSCSLASFVNQDAGEYNSAISDFNDRVLLTNILRARDYLPLNMTELATITGSISGTAGISATIPIGPHHTQASSEGLTPSISATSSPTFNMAALNTSGFTLGVLQPISPSYVRSKWNAGISRELLLMLFVKEMDFPNARSGADMGCPPTPKPTPAANLPRGSAQPGDATPIIRYVNNPDSPAEISAFHALVDCMIRSKVDLKSVNVLDAIGPPVELSAPVTSDGKAIPGAAFIQPVQNAFTLLTNLTDAPLYAGNAQDPNLDKGKFPGLTLGNSKYSLKFNGVQLYKFYPSQFFVCVKKETFPYELENLPQTGEAKGPIENGAASRKLEQKEKRRISVSKGAQNGIHIALSSNAVSSSPNNPAAPANPGKGANAGTAAPGGSSGGSITPALQINRVSSVLSSEDCRFDLFVLEPETEETIQSETQGFAHVEWRSPSEIFQYLGAILRGHPVAWTEQTDPRLAICVPAKNDPSTAPNIVCPPGTAAGASQPEASRPDRLFSLSSQQAGPVSVLYGGQPYYLPDGRADPQDHSGQVLAMLSDLVNMVKVSSDIPTQPQLQILPP